MDAFARLMAVRATTDKAEEAMENEEADRQMILEELIAGIRKVLL